MPGQNTDKESRSGVSAAGPARRVLVGTAVVGLAAALAVLLVVARDVLLLLFAGVLFAVLLDALAAPLKEHAGLGHDPALALVLLSGSALVGLGAWSMGPALLDQMQTLQQDLGESTLRLQDRLSGHAIGDFVLQRLPDTDDLDPQRMMSRIGGISASALGALGSVLTVLFIGVFIAFRPRLYLNGLVRLLPLRHRPRLKQVLDEAGSNLRWWLVGQLVSMLILWVSTWLLLHLLDVPLALVLALLTGLLTFIPYIGPLLAAIPISMVAFTQGPSTGLTVMIGYFIVQNVEGNLIMPLLLQRLVRLPAALTLGNQLLMGSLAGFPGVALATPLLATVMVLVRRLYVEDVLGDSFEDAALVPALQRDGLGGTPAATR